MQMEVMGYNWTGARIRTLVLLVEGTVATPSTEGVGLRVPLTVNCRI